MTNFPTNNDDAIDSRDVIAAIREIEERGDLLDELASLRRLAQQGEAASEDWPYGVTLVRDSYFVRYAQELAEDMGAVPTDHQWPNYCIDWEWAASELKHDYYPVDFDGVTYWVR